ncbi:MAG: hypothetical protein QOI64_61 [Solirubrobacteraceae bacterium]|nr:hypothetical protein [Solirubrobacteraceae bacterium]
MRTLIVRHPFRTDLAIALLLCAFVLQDVFNSSGYLDGSKAIYVPAALLMTVPLAWRRRAPLAVAVIVMAALAAQTIALDGAHQPDSPLPAWLLAIYTMAAECDRRRALAGLAVSMAGGLVWLGLGDFLFPVVVFGGAWLAGRFTRQSRDHARIVEERAEAIERAREADLRAVAADERARIARELHDVVGHRVSVMIVQAGAERLALDSPRANTAEALRAIESVGRQALSEMRHLLGILRASEDSAAPRPQPSVDDLAELLEQVRRAGLAVGLRTEGERRVLPDGVGLSVYRIVQEALTNVLKHASAGRAEVVIGFAPDAVDVVISDDGHGAASRNGAGHGLVGMRERVALYGGAFSAGPGPDGGFVVRAHLPLADRP